MISVVVPTFNRCDMLEDTLESLCCQEEPATGYEIVVVDNGSTDDVLQLVERIKGKTGVVIRYICERRLGLHWARHAGAHASHGDILAFVDDDVRVHPAWLKRLAEAYEDISPDCAGGKILIEWDREPPAWVVPYEVFLGKIDCGPEIRVLRQDESINGGNFSIRRDRLFEIGGFNPDQFDGILLGDGESGLCRKIHQVGWKMVWVPDAVLWHRQSVEKNATMADMKRRFRNNGAGVVYQDFRQNRPGWIGLLCRAARALLYGTFHQGRALGNRIRGDVDGYICYALVVSSYWFQVRYYLRLIGDQDLVELVLHDNWIREI